MYTQLGDGAVLYHAPETMAGGTTAIDFSQAKIVSENEAFLTIPLDQVTPGIYEPSAGEHLVYMGLRGLKPSFIK